jgi:hypothetical protein
MVFLPDNRRSVILADETKSISEHLVLSEHLKDTKEISAVHSQHHSPRSIILGKPLKFISDSSSETKIGVFDGSTSSSNSASRDVTPEPRNGDLNIDLRNVWNQHNQIGTRDSHFTSTYAKHYILELGARLEGNPKYGDHSNRSGEKRKVPAP